VVSWITRACCHRCFPVRRADVLRGDGTADVRRYIQEYNDGIPRDSIAAKGPVVHIDRFVEGKNGYDIAFTDTPSLRVDGWREAIEGVVQKALESVGDFVVPVIVVSADAACQLDKPNNARAYVPIVSFMERCALPWLCVCVRGARGAWGVGG
jgi:hypothetical protein